MYIHIVVQRDTYIYIYACNACVEKERAVAKGESEEPGDHEKTSLPKGEDIYLGLLHLTTTMVSSRSIRHDSQALE